MVHTILTRGLDRRRRDFCMKKPFLHQESTIKYKYSYYKYSKMKKLRSIKNYTKSRQLYFRGGGGGEKNSPQKRRRRTASRSRSLSIHRRVAVVRYDSSSARGHRHRVEPAPRRPRLHTSELASQPHPSATHVGRKKLFFSRTFRAMAVRHQYENRSVHVSCLYLVGASYERLHLVSSRVV